MKNERELKERIESNKDQLCPEGYLCLGNGQKPLHISEYFDIPRDEIYTFKGSWGMATKYAPNLSDGCNGDGVEWIYYIKESYATSQHLFTSDIGGLIEKAHNMIRLFKEGGHNIICTENQKVEFTPKERNEEFTVITTVRDANINTAITNKYFKKNPRAKYCVVLDSADFQCPIEFLELSKEVPYEIVPLNEKYSAEVHKDKIVVGCQTFPISILGDLCAAKNKMDDRK